MIIIIRNDNSVDVYLIIFTYIIKINKKMNLDNLYKFICH